MKSLTSTAIVALTAGIIGFTALAPAAIAQQGPGNGQGPGQHQAFNGNGNGPGHHRQMNNRRDGGPRGGGIVNLVCSEDGAERLEIAFVRLEHRVEPTGEQAALFEDLKATALTAQTAFADTCAAIRPVAGANATRPDPVEGMSNRIEIDKARIAALETVLPALDAFYASLTDAQKQALAPQGRKGRGAGNMQPGMGQPGMPAPAGEMAPEAPPA